MQSYSLDPKCSLTIPYPRRSQTGDGQHALSAICGLSLSLSSPPLWWKNARALAFLHLQLLQDFLWFVPESQVDFDLHSKPLSNKPHANSSSNIFHVQNVDMPQKFNNNTWAQHSPTNASEQGGGLTANVHDEKPWKYHVFHRFQSEIETFGKVSLQGVFSWHGLQKVQKLLAIAQGFQTRWNLLWGNVLKPHDSSAAYEMGRRVKCWRVLWALGHGGKMWQPALPSPF